MKKRERDPGILVRVDKETYRALRMLAAKESTMVAPYVRELLMKHVARKVDLGSLMPDTKERNERH